ncbi:ATP-grasp domain-containing protein [Kibdelosporangium aridum]|uniref:ATP-grasp domain-containing protein n=1 Tax=Kibdelosporangium aridum TaxID=2030 RepID=A0A1Y5X356_KIBAR|nr:hypothetical protein [Kibdelosporangium aridum]SMC67267.1 hypothetical protein SAMN05661093_01399 [Kibdelosporangium aridum]
MNVLLLHAIPHRLPDRIRKAPEIEHLSVLVEPEHAHRYDASVDVELVSNTRDPVRARDGALAVLGRRRIDHVITPFEYTLPAAGYLRDVLGLPGIDFSTTTRFTHKNVMKSVLAAAGLPVAPFHIGYTRDDIATAAAEFGWPLVVKPAVGAGCIDVFPVHGPDDLTTVPPGPLVIEKLLDVTAEYHCEGVVHSGKVRFTAVSRYLQPILRRREQPGLSGSYCLPPEHPARAQVARLHDEAVQALGLDSGVTHIEVLDTPQGMVIGEITCRMGGGGITQNVYHQYGIDLWREWLLLSLGMDPELPVGPRPGICAYYQLPVRTGPYIDAVDTAMLEAMESVLTVETHLRPGDIVPARRSLSFTPATVYLRVADEEELADQVRRLDELS